MQEKLAKIIHLLKKEFVQPELKEKSATEEFLSVCGTWEDDRTIDEYFAPKGEINKVLAQHYAVIKEEV
ncbi:MAG: hypothetical protein CV087_17710 [Candidatus Brocadia sp. WS118]|nr:MAG: hypothetical protein CV087_17710 [Candidatus Brocadia sp. WS118]